MGEGAALEVFSETGADLSKWPFAEHFVSWLNLCPNNKISGGKVISSMLLKKQPNAASKAFRHAANTVGRTGNKYAIVPTANNIATIQ